MKDVSVIVTAYNAEATIARALSSAADRRFAGRVEVIVVDDCSRDRTPVIIDRLCSRFDNIRSVRMPQNSGSPSRPRNVGISQATGIYLTFLDDDDYIDADRLIRMVEYAQRGGIQFLKGYLKTVRAGVEIDACRILAPSKRQRGLMEQIIAQQSTTSDVILHREFLIRSGVLFDTDIKIGEDTLFHTALLSHNPVVGYADNYFLHYCRQTDKANLSSTQEFTERAIYNHLHAWREAGKNLSKIGLSYSKLRLPSAVQWMLQTMVRCSGVVISEQCFLKLSDFVNSQRTHLQGRMPLPARYRKLFQSIVDKSYHLYQQEVRTRLLVSGGRVELLEPLFHRFQDEYDVRFENIAENGAGSDLLDWADIIWCRGLDDCAAWYSRHKLSHQTLIVQTLGDDGPVGDVDFAQVDCLTAPTFYHKHRLCVAHGVEEHSVVIFNPAEARAEAGGAAGGVAIVVGFGPETSEYAGVMDALRAFSDGDNDFVLDAGGPAESRRVITLHAAPGWDDYVQSAVRAVRSGLLCLLLSRPGAEYCCPPRMLFDSMAALLNEARRTGRSPAAYDEACASMRDFVADYYSEARATAELRAILEQARL